MPKRYCFFYPVSGSLEVYVDAEDDAQAKALADAAAEQSRFGDLQAPQIGLGQLAEIRVEGHCL